MTQPSLSSEAHAFKHSWFEQAVSTLSLKEASGWPDSFGEALLRWNKDSGGETIRVLSLFSGAGGLDIGFHDAGFTIVECNELIKDFSATLSLNSARAGRLGSPNIVCMDINDYDPQLENIDFIIGGPPCQTFSAAGARAAGVSGVDDARGHLFKQYVRILRKLNPKGFLFENVYRIVGAQGGKPWQLIQEAFQAVGYRLHWRILDAADFGVPQFRERLIIVGLKEGCFQFPYPTHGPDSKDKRPYYSARQAIETVVSTTKGTSIGGRHGHLLNDIPPGLNYSFYTDRMGHPTPHFGWRSKFSDYLYKADPNTPVRTIKAQGGQYTGPFHWDNRTFTVEELKRLQTFPDHYEMNGSRQKIIHQLGNSVPPQLSRILALSIAQQIFHRKLPFNLEHLPDSTKLGFRARKSKLTKIYAEKAREAIDKLPNQTKAIAPVASYQKNDCYTLSSNLVLKSAASTVWDYCFNHKIQDGRIDIILKDTAASRKPIYQYTVKLADKSKSARKSSQDSIVFGVSMRSFSSSYQSVTAVWKYLERLVQK